MAAQQEEEGDFALSTIMEKKETAQLGKTF